MVPAGATAAAGWDAGAERRVWMQPWSRYASSSCRKRARSVRTGALMEQVMEVSVREKASVAPAR